MTIKTRKQQILDSKTVADIFRQILSVEDFVDQDKEHLWTVGLDGKNRIKYAELVSLGTLNMSLAHPREIFRFAIMQSVAALIICHNHPSGDKTPSNVDNDLTKRLQAAGEILGINLLDHVIITTDTFYSYADDGKIA